jgi:hypothetical protein
MKAIDWLQERAPGFRELSGDERDAIMQFLLLWSLFEARALNTHGNANSILAVAKRWAAKGLLADESFNPELSYFQNRYYADGDFTYHFDHLNLRRADQPDLVQRVLKNEAADLAEMAAALLIIVYRLRNNLFHGVKGAYEIRGQFENFSHANAVLMQAIELHEQSVAAR